ncbi:DivIVA domain-containing protein [Arthrobacter sp. 24S4-2]|uniref:DivIVA domain-containing protein n=1 Tax=Arthrobacter sp. 24S4-2 TaxID=2575374 RepID=UPI0010C7838F|nr:DivIVA domain-containing protein [Arthrobacter sp. 24S4-2]QCO99243.1 DivIVA domain-containing protein [Arthrobacter sp. 24S4-2]
MDPVSFFLIFLAIAVIGAALFVGADFTSGLFRNRRPTGAALLDGFDEPVASLPPVLLPADAAPADVDRVRFALGLRGYRMDQVDQVLDELRDQLAARDREIAHLKTELAELAEPARPGETGA